ncbi:MAG: gp16 family protein [Desulfovibrionaceae bacterium]
MTRSKHAQLTPERRKLLAMAHAAPKEMGMDDDARRAMLDEAFGVESCADLTTPQLRQLRDMLKARGWRPKHKGRQGSPHPIVRKVYALWAELASEGIASCGSRDALRAFVKRMVEVDDPDWLTVAQAQRIIEAMKQWRKRVLTETPPETA